VNAGVGVAPDAMAGCRTKAVVASAAKAPIRACLVRIGVPSLITGQDLQATLVPGFCLQAVIRWLLVSGGRDGL